MAFEELKKPFDIGMIDMPWGKHWIRGDEKQTEQGTILEGKIFGLFGHPVPTEMVGKDIPAKFIGNHPANIKVLDKIGHFRSEPIRKR